MDTRKKRQLMCLAGLLGLLLVAIYYVWSPEKGSVVHPAPSANAGVPLVGKEGILTFEKGLSHFNRKKEIPIALLDPVLHIEKLSQFDPGTPSTARNMFALGVVPPPPGVKNTSTAGGASPTSPASASPSLPVRPPAPPSVVINLKYMGFKQEGLPKRRQGFFSEGDNVFLAGEGELIANRYRVIKVQDNWAEIEDLPSKTRQQLQLINQ